jgi:uncharacterized coiled-coil DUF342 family protein
VPHGVCATLPPAGGKVRVPAALCSEGVNAMGSYMNAFQKDVDNLLEKLKKLNAALKKNPNDKDAKKEKDALAPFLTKDALEKRMEHAKKLDGEELGKIIKGAGLPGW